MRNGSTIVDEAGKTARSLLADLKPQPALLAITIIVALTLVLMIYSQHDTRILQSQYEEAALTHMGHAQDLLAKCVQPEQFSTIVSMLRGGSNNRQAEFRLQSEFSSEPFYLPELLPPQPEVKTEIPLVQEPPRDDN
jgi:hypothetical protein